MLQGFLVALVATLIYMERDVYKRQVLDKIELFATPYFRIAENGESTEAVTLCQEDFPITIRNPCLLYTSRCV